MATQPTAQHTPAFPNGTFQRGMSLRDWFAGQALAGMMANHSMPFMADYAEVGTDIIADAAFDIADAMIAKCAKATGAA